MKRLHLFGASGSIGGSVLSILRDFPGDYSLATLSVHTRTERLPEWIAEFAPRRVAITDKAARRDFLGAHPEHKALVLPEDEPVSSLLDESAEIAVNAILGFAGLPVSLAILERGVDLALANKESLVCGGGLFMKAWESGGGRVLPVDSEHSAVFQLVEGRGNADIRKVWLTASGGPFLGRSPGSLADVTPAQALRHPTWQMGAKISVDSATLVNKGLELIEAAVFFKLPAKKLGVLIHPSSTVHALLELEDSSVLAQLAAPDMRQPILHALSHPGRQAADYGKLDFGKDLRLDFYPASDEAFPAVKLALDVLRAGGAAPLVLNAADEVAVASFLDGQLPFNAIVPLIEASLQQGQDLAIETWEDTLASDLAARRTAASLIPQFSGK